MDRFFWGEGVCESSFRKDPEIICHVLLTKAPKLVTYIVLYTHTIHSMWCLVVLDFLAKVRMGQTDTHTPIVGCSHRQTAAAKPPHVRCPVWHLPTVVTATTVQYFSQGDLIGRSGGVE